MMMDGREAFGDEYAIVYVMLLFITKSCPSLL